MSCKIDILMIYIAKTYTSLYYNKSSKSIFLLLYTLFFKFYCLVTLKSSKTILYYLTLATQYHSLSSTVFHCAIAIEVVSSLDILSTCLLWFLLPLVLKNLVSLNFVTRKSVNKCLLLSST